MANPAKLTGEAPPQAVQRAARNLGFWGSVGFWVELVLGVIAGLILALAIAGYAAEQQKLNPFGSSIGLAFSVIGLITIGISSYFFNRYTKIAKRLRTSTDADRPSRSDILRLIRIGLIISLSGMALTLLGAFPFSAFVLSKAFYGQTIGQQFGVNIPGNEVLDRLVTPYDIFLFQAFLNSVLAHFVGAVTSLWLFDRLNR